MNSDNGVSDFNAISNYNTQKYGKTRKFYSSVKDFVCWEL